MYFSGMNFTWIIVLIIGILVIKFATGVLLKLIGVICLLGGLLIVLYQNAIWPFHENSISIEWLEKKYCDGENRDEPKCNCIVKLIRADLNNRFTADELKELSENRIKQAYVIKKSYKVRLNEIKTCLGDNADTELKSFNETLWLQDKETLKKTGDWFSEKSDNIKESYEDLKDEKSDIDRKYER